MYEEIVVGVDDCVFSFGVFVRIGSGCLIYYCSRGGWNIFISWLTSKRKFTKYANMYLLSSLAYMDGGGIIYSRSIFFYLGGE